MIEQYKKQGLVYHTKNTKDLTELLKTIDGLPPYVGAPKFPRDAEGTGTRAIVILANFIIKRFPSLSPEQIVEAFELGAVGDLYKDGKVVEIAAYGRPLNIELLGRVLGAYKLLLQERRMRPQVIAHEKRIEAPKYEPVTAEFHYKHLLQDVKQNGKLPPIHLWETVYKYMVENGLAPKLSKWAKMKYPEKTKGSIAYILNNAPWRLIVRDAFIELGHLEPLKTQEPKTPSK